MTDYLQSLYLYGYCLCSVATANLVFFITLILVVVVVVYYVHGTVIFLTVSSNVVPGSMCAECSHFSVCTGKEMVENILKHTHILIMFCFIQ